MHGGVGRRNGRMLYVRHGAERLNNLTHPVPLCVCVCVCFSRSVRLRPRPGGVLHEEWRVSVHAGLPTHARHPLQWLRGLCGGGSGHRSGQDLPPRLFRLHHLQVRHVELFLSVHRKDICIFFPLICDKWTPNAFFPFC